jgi:hypothetical protein
MFAAVAGETIVAAVAAGPADPGETIGGIEQVRRHPAQQRALQSALHLELALVCPTAEGTNTHTRCNHES